MAVCFARALVHEYNSALRRQRRWKRIAEVRCDRERNARYLNWKCVRVETQRAPYRAPVALLTPHIAEAGIGKDVPLIFASDMKTFKFVTRAFA